MHFLTEPRSNILSEMLYFLALQEITSLCCFLPMFSTRTPFIWLKQVILTHLHLALYFRNLDFNAVTIYDNSSCMNCFPFIFKLFCPFNVLIQASFYFIILFFPTSFPTASFVFSSPLWSFPFLHLIFFNNLPLIQYHFIRNTNSTYD